MRIGIIGNGVVGSALAHCFGSKGHNVFCWDKDESKSTHEACETVEGSDLVFVCLPTPQTEDGLACDTSAIDWFFDFIGDATDRNYVLKSTVPVGTTRRLSEQYNLPNLVHSPEFLTTRTAEQDAANPRVNVIGFTEGDPDKVPGEQGKWDTHWLTNFYLREFPLTPLHKLWSEESEAVKLFQNSISAAKIALMNELYCYCQVRELDWHDIRQVLLAQGWINPRHTEVPGPDGKHGFGGACLPKDLANMITCFKDADCYHPILTAAYHRNLDIDRFTPSKKHWDVGIDDITPEQWKQMSKLERSQWYDNWAVQGHIAFSCLDCGYPVPFGGAHCDVCDGPRPVCPPETDAGERSEA